jgi:type I restriction enzyme, S subunit
VSADWPSKALAEVCEIKPPKGEAKRKLKDKDLVSFVPMEDLGVNRKFLESKVERRFGEVAGSYTYFADGDVLLAKITPCFENGKLGIARALTNGIGFGSSEYFVLRPNAPLSSEYLYYFLSQDSFRAEGERTMSGAVGHKRVSKEFLERCQIPLPSLAEQQSIVALLDETFGGLATATANAEQNLKNARELFNSVLNAEFSAGYQVWPKEQLVHVCHKIQDGAHHSPKVTYPGREPNTFPYITSKNVRNNYMDLTDLGFVGPEFHESIYPRCNPELGDLLLTKDGASTGNVTLNTLDEPFSLLSSVCLIKTDSSRISPAFLKYYIQSREGFEQITGSMTGTAIRRIILKTIKSATVPVPTLQFQTLLVRKLDDLLANSERLTDAYRKKIEVLAKLRQSLLQKAFSGELTSPPSSTIQEAAE